MRNNKNLNVLVVRLSALGDVAMSVPAIYSVAETYPTNTFHVVTSKLCAQLFVGAPANVMVHPLEAVTLGNLFRCVRSLKVDVVADLHNVLRTWIMDIYFRLRGKTVAMLDKRRWERGAVKKAHYATPVIFTDRYFDVFKRLKLPCMFFFTNLSADDLPELPDGLPAKNGKKWVGIAPFARYTNKVYPLGKMQKVADMMAAHPETEVFLFGGRKEKEIMEKWCGRSARLHNMAGRFTLGEELALMARLDVMLSMDSANMHLASLVGTRVASIWGSTSPACGFLGWRQDSSDAILASCDCQPCTIAGSNNCRFGDMHCLTDISPETVADKLKQILASEEPAS